jgi:hypothetical protein
MPELWLGQPAGAAALPYLQNAPLPSARARRQGRADPRRSNPFLARGPMRIFMLIVLILLAAGATVPGFVGDFAIGLLIWLGSVALVRTMA